MKTSCKDCFFATWNEDKQVGCSIGKLDKHRELGFKVVENNNSFEIIDKICTFCVNKNDEAIKNKSNEDAYKLIREKVALKFTAVVDFREGNTIGDLDDFCNSINRESVKPHQIVVVNNQKKITAHQISDFLKQYDLPHYQVQTLFIRDLEGKPYHIGALMDLYFPNIKGNFFGVYSLPYSFPSGLLSDIDKSITDDMDRFVAILSESGNGNIFMSYAAKACRFNLPYDVGTEEEPKVLDLLVDKLQYLAEKNKEEGFVRRMK